MRFSLIIPVHNAASTLNAALDSIVSQSFTDFEVIVVDDASTDDSARIAARHPLMCRIVRLSANVGPGSARNTGAKEAAGDYLTFLDSDDRWFPWTLGTLDSAISRYPSSCFVSGRAVRSGEQIAPGQSPIGGPTLLTHQNYFETAKHDLWIGVGGIAIKRSTFKKAGGFAGWNANCEDTDLWMRLGLESSFLRIEAPPLFFYALSETSLTHQSKRIASGYQELIAQEKNDHYPGGNSFRRERQTILTRHARAACFNLITLGQLGAALRIYSATLIWNFRQFRFKFVLGFWVLILSRLFQTDLGQTR